MITYVFPTNFSIFTLAFINERISQATGFTNWVAWFALFIE